MSCLEKTSIVAGESGASSQHTKLWDGSKDLRLRKLDGRDHSAEASRWWKDRSEVKLPFRGGVKGRIEVPTYESSHQLLALITLRPASAPHVGAKRNKASCLQCINYTRTP